MKKNDILTVTVTDINHSGLGVAKQDGAVIFIQGGVTDDVLKIKIIKEAKSYYVARIEEILSPSPYRTEPSCKCYKRCGGCIYQNITPDYENQLKESRVKNELQRFKVRCESFEPIESAKIIGYRNKLQCPVSDDGKVGFYAQKSHEVIDIESCELQEAPTEPIYRYLRGYVRSHPEMQIRHIYLRSGVGTGEVMVCLVCRRESFNGQEELVKKITERFPEIKSIILNVNPDDTNVVLGKKCLTLYGKSYIEDVLCGLRFKISPLSFYQVNHDCTELLYRTAAEFAEVKPTDTLVDLFCGIGTIGLCVSSIAPVNRLIGVEIVPEAIGNAKENAALNGVTNAEFYCSPAEKFDFGTPDVLIVDPPRKGLAPSLIETIGKVAPKRIVYISCSPDTLARDCSLLTCYGYEVKRVKPVNMFPRTSHVETVILLSRKDVSELEVRLENVRKNQKVLLARKKKLEQSRDALDPLDRNYDMKFDSFTDSLDKVFDELREVEKVIDSIERKIRNAHNSKKTKEDAIQLLLEFGQAYPTLPEAEQKKIANVLIDSIEIFPTKRAFGYLKTIHFSFPVLSGDEIKQTMTIWDTHPDILDEDGNFNGYNPEDDLPPVDMETGTIVVHPEGGVFPPKRITDESVVCLTRKP